MRKFWFAVGMMMGGTVVTASANSPNFTLDRNIFQLAPGIVATSVFTPSASGSASYLLYDSAGEVVKNFKPAAAVANVPQTFTWDGKNESGEPVASGFYFFRFRVDLGTYIKKLLVIR